MRTLLRAWIVSSTLLAVCFGYGCGSSNEPEQLEAGEWLARVERAHEVADGVPPAQASATLRDALVLAVPTDVQPAHRRVVHQDLLFRIARAELEARAFDRALAAADGGLALGRELDLFTANLLLARGEALEGLGRDTEAAATYYEALEINQKLLHHVLGTKDAGIP